MSIISITNDTNFKKNAEYVNTILNEIEKTFILNNPSYKNEIYIKLSNDGDIYLMTLFKTIAGIKFDESCGRYQSIPARGYEDLNLHGLEDIIYHLPKEITKYNNTVWAQ